MALNRLRLLLFILLCAILLGIVSLMVFLLFLPGYLETRGIPGFAKKAGIDSLALHIRKIGLTGADLADVSLGIPPKLVIDSIRIDYSPMDLLSGRIARISVRGVSFQGLTLGGRADIEVRGKCSIAPFKISSLSISSRLHGAELGYRGIRIQNVAGPDDTKTPVGFSLETQDFRSWAVGVPPFLCSTPAGAVRMEAAGTITMGKSTLTAQAVVQTGAFTEPAQPLSPTLPMLNLPALRWELTAASETEHGWQARVDGRATPENNNPKMTADFNGLRVQAASPIIGLAAKGMGMAFSGTATLDIPAIEINAGEDKITLPAVAVSSQFAHLIEDSGINMLSFKTRSQPVLLISKAVQGEIPQLEVIGNIARTADGGIGVSGRLEFANAGFSAMPRGVAISGISANVPFQWPPAGESAPGKFSAASLQWRNLSLGGMATTIQQRGNSVVVSGKYNSRLLPGLSVDFNGNANLTERDWIAEGHIRLPGYRIAEELDLGRFSAQASGILCKGEISLSADLTASRSRTAGSMTLGLRDARVTISDTGMMLDGLSMNLAFPDALALRSAPQQVIRVSKVSLGDIVATDVSADFQVESPNSVFIEQSRFKWCGGNVDTQAFRISPGVHDYSLTLYCDRLNLAEILEQFGAAKADGDGTVNGRIPVTFSGKRLAFQDGFLYSTPGGGGKIKLAESKILTAGLPPDSPEAVQMAIANEALKDFEYTWVRLNLGTEANELLMQLKFDGKPASPLPFVYKRDIGRFIRVEADAKGSVFQGIRLDVNFRLPLDDILKYKEILNRMN